MNIDTLKRLLLFVLLCLSQVLMFNRIHLFGWGTPLLYIYMVLLFPRDYPKWASLLWCFALGLVNDTFSNTPGVACASLTLLGALQPYFLELFVPRNVPGDFKPSSKTLGINKFFFYTFSLVLFYCLLFFALESFNFFNWLLWLECAGTSTLITLMLIWALESVRTE